MRWMRSDYVGLPRKRKRNPGADDTNCVMILFFFIIIVFIAWVFCSFYYSAAASFIVFLLVAYALYLFLLCSVFLLRSIIVYVLPSYKILEFNSASCCSFFLLYHHVLQLAVNRKCNVLKSNGFPFFYYNILLFVFHKRSESIR